MKNFREMIQIRDGNGEYKDAIACLDTMCHGSNWISAQLITRRLKLGQGVENLPTPKTYQTASGTLSATRMITPSWYFKADHRAKYIIDDQRFFIFEDSPENRQLDLLIGVETIVELKLVARTRTNAVYTLLQQKAENLCKSLGRCSICNDD